MCVYIKHACAVCVVHVCLCHTCLCVCVLCCVLQSAHFIKSQMGIGLEELMIKQARAFPAEKAVPYILTFLVDTIYRLKGRPLTYTHGTHTPPLT